MKRPRLRSVVPGELDFSLRLTWDDGSADLVRLEEPVFRLKLFAPLRDPAAFRSVRLTEWGWGVCWADDLDYSADALWRLAREQSRKGVAAE